RHCDGARVAVEDLRGIQGKLDVQGPNAVAILKSVFGLDLSDLKRFRWTRVENESESWIVSRTGYTGADGVEIYPPAASMRRIWQALTAAGARPCGLGARDTLRLEAGMNLYGNEMNQDINPLIAALGWTVSFKDAGRNFIGREAIDGAAPQEGMIGLKLNERGVMRTGMKVRTAQGEGVVTSGTMSPTMGVSIGMARVPVGAQAGEQAEVEIRGKWVAAGIVSMPFVRQGKVLV
ncbi:MAG: glycine cleavage system aminomethyltransferase GcvT, partial [Alcaligenaceae bacterium]|nr:glycine cleavage system aminomethyltransferase GcvT [Alcaligenaceae bacterium]